MYKNIAFLSKHGFSFKNNAEKYINKPVQTAKHYAMVCVCVCVCVCVLAYIVWMRLLQSWI